MQKNTIISLYKRSFKLLGIITFIFSSFITFGSISINNYKINPNISNSDLDIENNYYYNKLNNGLNALIETEYSCNEDLFFNNFPKISTRTVSEYAISNKVDEEITVNNPGIGLIKTGVFNDENSNGIAEIGETVSYNFVVTNTGQTVLDEIIVEDPLVSVLGSPISLNPGDIDNTSFSATYPITQNDIDNGFVLNQATVTGCYDQEPVDPQGNCDGKVTYLKLQYQGTIQNAQIRIVENDGQTIFNDIVQPNEEFQFYGQEGNPPTMGPKIEVFINDSFSVEIHTSCSQPIGPGSVFGDFEVIEGASKNGGPLDPVEGLVCVAEISDLSDNDSNNQNDPTVVLLPGPPPTPRECLCSPLYENSNFEKPVLISGSSLSEGAVYRFENVFPNNPYGTTLDALVRIDEFSGGASLLDIDVIGTGRDEHFQPRINATNNDDQSVLFNITFVTDGGTYGDEVVISFFGTPFDIDGNNSDGTREYAEISLPDAYYVSNNTVLDITQSATVVRGEAMTTAQAPGGDVSLDPRWTYSNYFENKSSLTYRIGKLDGQNDRYYSLDMGMAEYEHPNSVLITYPVICGNVTDETGAPLVGVAIDVTGSDGSAQTVTTDVNGHYEAVAEIPEFMVDVTYEIRENDPEGFISVNDTDGANDNLITETITLLSSCGNDFIDGVELMDGWSFECEDDKIVEQFGNNANCNESTNIEIPNFDNVYQYVVEIVYKGSNPGPTLQFTDAAGTSFTLARSEPVGTSSNVYVYRGLVSGTTSSITYIDTNNQCNLQSVVVYAFRENQPTDSSSTGVFTNRSGYNDIQTITIDIPSSTAPRDLVVEAPISELTNDGRYLLFRAVSGGISQEIIIYGPDASLPGGNCCLARPTLTLSDVPGDADEVVITIDTRNNQNGQSVNGQSYVIAAAVNVEGGCLEDLTLVLENKDDILCNGDATGAITVMAAGGLPPYEYTLNGGLPQASPTFNGLIAGSYVVTVTDSIGNNAILNVLITQPEALSIQFTKIDSTLSGGCSDGQATATVTGGTLPYMYQWSGPGGFSQNTATITGLIEGIYTLDVSDGNNCTIQQMVVIDCVDDCDAVISLDNKTNVLCAGELTGSATVSASSLNDVGASFTFSWSTGQIDAGITVSTIDGLGAGVYNVDVTIDGTECPAETLSITITEPSSALNTTASATCESGPGANDGTASVLASGGTPPYTYSWNTGETTPEITGLSAGDYTVSVTDANNCMNMVTVNVCSIPCDLAAIASSTMTSCQGETDGTATVGVTGGSGNITYLWSPGGQTTQSIDNLTAGTYTVTVTDLVTTCVVQSTTTVNEPVSLSSGISVTDLTCFGDNSGALDLTVTGGTFPYTFVWSNGATNEDLVGLAAGTYEVTITDANGCVTANSAEVSGPTESLDLSYTVVDVLCNGDSTGAVDVSVTGGTPPYFYSWNNGATTEDLNDLAAGNYSVVVTDTNGCQLTKNNIVINEPNNPLSLILTKQNPTAAQDCQDGEATSTVSGGTAPYTYLWSPSTGNQETPTATNLPLGIHTVTITDDNGCVLVQSVVLNDCTTICDAIISIDDITDVLCAGDSTGSTTVSASSLTFPNNTFTFTWNTGQMDSGVTTSTLSGLAAGVYTVSVTIDGSDCQPVGQSVTIVEPASALNVTASATDESGPTTGDGTATATASGGTPPYTYSWSPGGATTEVITDLSAGTYTVTVTDANGCTATAVAMVNPATCLDLAVTAYATSTTCSGDSDGTATAYVTGGSGNITYSWSPGGATTQVITGLTAGAYIVTITDTVTECTVQATTTVNEPNTLSSGIAVSNVICFGEDTGSLDLTVSGGTFPYTFAWSNGATTEDINNLVAGTYNVTITDANGCTTTDSANVLQPDTANTSTYAFNDFTATWVDFAVPGNVLTNDEDLEGNAQIVISNTDPSNGIVVLNANGDYIYIPDDGFAGVDSFEYTIEDDDTCDPASDTATVYINVIPPSENTTTANRDNAETYVDVPVIRDGTNGLLANDDDAQGDNQVVTTVGTYTTTLGGSITVAGDGSYTYVPPLGFVSGPKDTFTYAIVDDAMPQVAVSSAVLAITVYPLNPENDTFAYDDFYFANIDTPLTGNVLTNDIDNQGDTQMVTATSPISGPNNGSVTLNADGSFTYTPNTGYFGPDEFVYTIVDNGDPQATDTATVHILIDDTPENTILAIDDVNVTMEGQTVDGNVGTNDWNFDGPADTEVFTLVDGTGPSNGTLTFNPDGTYTYTPDAGFVGEDQFEYQICDGGDPVACDTAVVYIEVLGDSGPPVAVPDTNVTTANTPVDGEVLPNDYDTNGDPISVTANTDPANGTVVMNPDGSYTYTPDPDFIGEDTFTYTICDTTDPEPLCDTAIVTIQVLPPDNYENITHAVDDEYYTTAGTGVSANVLDNDTDNQGDTQVVTDASPISGPNNGSVTLNADGSFTYTPDAGFVGTDSFVYSIVDSGDPQATDTATVYIYVDNDDTPENTILAIDDVNVTMEGQTVDGNVGTNDWNFDGPADTEVFTLVDGTGPSNGTLTFNPDGTYTYTPDAGFVGEDQFEYQICDGGDPVACDTAVVYIEVLGDSGPPVAVPDTNVTTANTPVDGEVLPNDYDTNGDPISVTANTDPANGTVVMNPDGSYTYTPDPDFIGEDTFTYTICDTTDPEPLCDTAIVTIQVLPPDNYENITHAVDDEYYTTAGTGVSANVLDNDTDNQGDTQVVTDASPISGPNNGSVTLNADGSFTYTPDAGFVGTDSFVYSIVDSGDPQATDTATVYIYVDNDDTPENTILAIDDVNVTMEGQTVDGNVGTNDWNFDGPADTEVFTLVDGTGPSNGTLTFNPDGTYTYTPDAGFVGEDQFEYQICDGGDPVACDTAVVYIEVLGDSGPPVAVPDTNVTTANTPVDGEVLPNDYDTNGDPISVTANTDPANGTVVMNPDGSYTYTPDPDFIGEDTFTYTICDTTDPEPLCDTAIVTIQVLPPDNYENITHAVDDEYYTTAGTGVSANVLDNDTDNQGDTQVVTDASPISGPNNGSVTLNADGSFTYTPDAGFVGTDSFVYSIVDSGDPQATDTATVYIYVDNDDTPENTILAIDDVNVTMEGQTVDGNVGTNDWNFDGPADTEVFTLVDGTGPSNGTLTFNPDGTYTYTPDAGFVGEDQFEYQICDGGDPVACDTAVVYIEVLGDSGPPVAVPDTNVTTANTPVDGEVLPNDYDTNGDPISVTANTDPANGTVVMNPDGSYTYTPDPDFIGEDTFTYTICDTTDPEPLCDTAIVTIQVLPPDNYENITHAVDDEYYTTAGTGVSANVLDNDTDNQGDTQVVTDASPISGPNNGSVTLNADGSFTYTPDAGFVGTDSFVYSIVDSGDPQATDTATVYIYVDQAICTDFDVKIGIVDVLCFGETTGAIELIVASGEAPFTFLWNNGATTEDISDLEAGTYTVDITDANGCVTTISATVLQPDDPISVEIITENGIATAVATGGSPPYTYIWSNGETTESITIPDGTYSVRVTDANGCDEEAIGTVGPCEDIEISTTITPNGDQFNEFFEVNFIGGGCNFPIDLKIVNRWGAIVFESNDYQNNWNGVAPDSSLGSAGLLPTGTYYYVIILRNSGLNPVSGPLYIGTK